MTDRYAYVEVDQSGGDHLGDAAELVDPYPLTRAAQSRALTVQRGDTHTNPEEAAEAVAGFAGNQTRHGLSVRAIVAPEWSGNTFELSAGVNAFQVADEDPHRIVLLIRNLADGYVYVSNSPTQLPGPGSILLPPLVATRPPAELSIRSTAPVWLWTTAAFAPSSSFAVVWYVERAPVT